MGEWGGGVRRESGEIGRRRGRCIEEDGRRGDKGNWWWEGRGLGEAEEQICRLWKSWEGYEGKAGETGKSIRTGGRWQKRGEN